VFTSSAKWGLVCAAVRETTRSGEKGKFMR
jgi:hypothetical protein